MELTSCWLLFPIKEKKKISFLNCFYVSAVAVYSFIWWHSFEFDIFKGKRHENCSSVLWRLHGVKLKCNLIKSDLQLVSFAGVVRVITQRFSPREKRCVTTLITAAKKTNLQPIRKCFLFRSIFGEAVLFCKKGTTRIKRETLS